MQATSRALMAAAVAAAFAACGAAPTIPIEESDGVETAAEPQPDAAAEELAGTQWVVAEIDGEPVDDVEFSVAFESADRVSGLAGCNRFFGTYATEGAAIAFGHLGATQMMCPPEQMEQEQRFLDLLARAERFERRLATLVLSTGETAQTMTLKRIEPSPLVTGMVLYRERIALPPDASLTVRLVDLEAGTAALGEEVIHPTGQIPIPFEIAYDPAQIREGGSYALQARIEAGGGLDFASPRAVPVIAGGHPSRDVEVIVERVEPPPATPAGG